MSRSVSAPSLVTNTSPCWNGFIVPGSTFRYGSSFCIVTRRPRAFSSAPRLEAVRPLPRDEATPPVTKMCLVVMDLGGIAKRGLPWSRGEVRPAPASPSIRKGLRGRRSCGFGAPDSHRQTTGPRGTSLSAPGPVCLRPRCARVPYQGTEGPSGRHRRCSPDWGAAFFRRLRGSLGCRHILLGYCTHRRRAVRHTAYPSRHTESWARRGDPCTQETAQPAQCKRPSGWT